MRNEEDRTMPVEEVETVDLTEARIGADELISNSREEVQHTRLNLFEEVIRTGWGEERRAEKWFRKRNLRRAKRIQSTTKLYTFTRWEIIQIVLGLTVLCIVFSASLVGSYLWILGQFGVLG